MRCKSTSSINTDGYRAGSEIGEALGELEPEVILIFASITYDGQFGDVFDGLRDALGSGKALLFGGTSDGIYETERVAHHGICALGLNSDGVLRWSTSIEPGVRADSFSAAQKCARRVSEDLGGEVNFAFAFADGVNADGSRIVDGLSTVLATPFVGGLAADDRKFLKSRIFLNGEIHEDAVALLAARGPISFIVSSASGWCPLGETGIVEGTHGSTIDRISGMTPQAFLREQIGKAPGETDLGIVPLATYHAEGQGHYFLRTPSGFDAETGAATMFGSVEKGASVRVCTATRGDVLRAVEDAMRKAKRANFEPCGALVVSCAGRKWMLEEGTAAEVEKVLAAVGRRIPLVGLPSFGEIGPFLDGAGVYTPTFFHNVTFVVCLFGA
ncbi:MAG: FIST N-terminal domain-containing protein [Chthoniobacteraceae bacterium]